jgi:hypothetical protein
VAIKRSGFMQCGEFLHCMSDYFLRKVSGNSVSSAGLL